jgi:hypothetical protein
MFDCSSIRISIHYSFIFIVPKYLFFRVKLTFKVDDESGTGLLKAFDDALLNVVELNC